MSPFILLQLTFAGICLILIWILLAAVIAGFFYKVPYVPSRTRQIRAMIDAAHITEADHVADLGAGDGKILFLAEKLTHAQSYTGYENAPLPLIFHWLKKIIHQSRVVMRRENFFHAPLSQYTVLLLYLLPETLDELLPKLEKELPKGARVISNVFHFSKKEPAEIITSYKGEEVKRIFVYTF